MARVVERLRQRSLEAWITTALVAGSVLFVLFQLEPSLLLLNTTPAGGDMGAHVWAPAFLREELLPRFRLSGWAPDWYDGFPAFQFYMVLPSLLIVVLDVVLFLPYNVAFKLVSVLGLLALPVAAWALGRLARLPFPMPAALAVATVPYIFDRSFTIYGGNAASTLAGEFAFTISMVLALLFLGVVLRGLESGRHRGAAAALLALTVLCHLIPGIFALLGAGVALALSLQWTRRSAVTAVGAIVGVGLVAAVLGLVPAVVLVLLAVLGLGGWAALHPDVKERWLGHMVGNRLRAWWLVSAAGVGAFITAFWTVPFYARRAYMTDMGWEKLHNYAELLFPGRIGDALSKGPATISGDLTLVIVLAVVGAGTSLAFHRRFGTWLSTLALVLAVAVVVAPQGRLWNARLLPFWYLCLYFLAALAVVELISAVGVLLSRDPVAPGRRALLVGPVVAALVVVWAVALPLRALPFGHTSADGSTYSWFGISTKDHSFIPSWVKWNYSGYERKPAYPEYQQVVATMKQLGEERGCGRAMWEYDKDLDRFGTPMALMLLPYWTDGCIGSMEGLYFEASATTPYHFLNQSELSAGPSRAERDLPYGNLDVGLGINHLQLLGVKYYMAFSDAAVAQASKVPDLTLAATYGKWHIYEVAHTELVQPLANEPVVVDGASKGGQTWQDMAVDWYLDRSRWGVMDAASGPKPWQRIRPGEVPIAKPYSATTVTDIETNPEMIRFKVDRTGAPVLIKASYFPNWKTSNAEGPFRVAPNLMVVVPRDNIVTLRFARTSVDWTGIGLTLLGIWLAVQLGRRRRLIFPPRRRAERPAPPPSGGLEEELVTAGRDLN